MGGECSVDGGWRRGVVKRRGKGGLGELRALREGKRVKCGMLFFS